MEIWNRGRTRYTGTGKYASNVPIDINVEMSDDDLVVPLSIELEEIHGLGFKSLNAINIFLNTVGYVSI